MISSNCLPLRDNQNPLKTSFPHHLLVMGLTLYSVLRQIRQGLQKEQNQNFASLDVLQHLHHASSCPGWVPFH